MNNRALFLSAAITLLTVAKTSFAATTTMLTGGDAGQGLTLDPANVVAALNVYGGNYTLQGVDFTTWSEGDMYGGTLVFGGGESSANDNAMRGLIDQLGFASGTNSLDFVFSGLTPHATYQLDLLQSVLHYNPREQAIVANGTLVTLVDLALGAAYNTSFGATATGAGTITVQVVASGGFGGTGFQDGAVMNALVVTAVPEPATCAAFLGLAAMTCALARRRRADRSGCRA